MKEVKQVAQKKICLKKVAGRCSDLGTLKGSTQNLKATNSW